MKAVLAAAALLYFLLGRLQGVGLLNDDAEYILAARSLASGRGLALPRMPGWPLVLAPGAALARPPFEWLKLYPIALTLCSAALFWKLLEGRVGRRARLAALALYALNPIVALGASRLFSEPLFVCVALAAFALARGGRPRAAALAAAFAAVVRGEGLLVAVALAAGAWRGRDRALLGWALAALAFVGVAGAAGLALREVSTLHVGFWLRVAGSLEPRYWAEHLVSLPPFAVWVVGLGLPSAPSSIAAKLAAGTLCLAAAAAAASGLGRLERSERGRAPLWAMYSFAGAYFLLHLAWPDSDPRFFVVLLPFALLALAAAAERLRPAAAVAGLAVWLGCYAFGAASVYADEVQDPGTHRVPEASLSWLRARTPPSSRVWAFYDWSLVRLYAEREGVLFDPPAQPDAFRHELLSRRVDYLFYAPLRFGFEPVAGIERVRQSWERTRVWAASDPAAFEPVFEDGAEGSAIFRVVPDPVFERAYALYLEALADFALARWTEGLARLEESLRSGRRLPAALNAYGATCLVASCDEALGERRLLEALRLRPDFALARANLDRLRTRRRRRPQG